MARSLCILFLLLGTSSSNTLAAEPQLWFFSILRLKPDPIQVDLMIHERQLSGFNDFGLFMFQPRFSTSCGENLRCAVNYSYLVQELTRDQVGEVNVLHQNRFEGEINPLFKLREDLIYNGRNRFEYLTNSSVNYVSSRFRHRSLFEFPKAVKNSVGLVTGSEIFWSFEENRFNQYRVVPLGTRFDISPGQQVSLLPLIMLNRVEGEWRTDFVLWIELFSNFLARAD